MSECFIYKTLHLFDGQNFKNIVKKILALFLKIALS